MEQRIPLNCIDKRIINNGIYERYLMIYKDYSETSTISSAAVYKLLKSSF